MELNENLFLEYNENEYAHDSGWKKVDSKEVKDSDGFMTEYTWYTNDAEDTHIFIFGDSDIYGPDDSYADAEFDSYDLAKEWFDNYYGFDHDEDLEESLDTDDTITWNSLTEADLEDFGIVPVNTYENPEYYCVDTGLSQQVVVAQSNDGKIMIEEDTDGLGFTEGEEFESEDAFLAEYEKRINGQLKEAIKPNIESEELKELAQKHNIKILDAMSNGDLRMEGAGADLMKFYQEAEKLGLWEVDPSLYECNDKVNETLTMHNFDEFKAIADEVGLVTAEDLERFRKEEMQPGESELDAIKRYKQELIDAGVDLSKLVNEATITISRAEMNRLDKEVEDARKDVAKYNIPMKAQMNSSGETESIPDFEAVPENQRDAAKAAYDRYQKAIEARPDRAKNIIKYEEDELTEGIVKDIALDIEAEEDFSEILKSKLLQLKKELNYLQDYAKREIGKGGAFDSIEEIDEAIASVKAEIANVEAKLAIVLKR